MSIPPHHPATSHTNRLAGEKSPYLLQHQHNPVNWYPWGPEAFARAQELNCPIFLSIGYSTCHWCHVMERESFENVKIARFLNAHFVCIKVDREERPDLDRLYMTFVQATTGQGGWPLTVVLTPDQRPFFGGTYFPPENLNGQPGLFEMLHQIERLWTTQGDQLTQSAENFLQHLRLASEHDQEQNAPELTPQTLRHACARLKSSYDATNGGFGIAPKFPQPSRLLFLLRHGKNSGDQEAVQMVFHTCHRMAAGGIHDHLGGGFARYATDAQWRIPHFEKMLYDNALLAQLYIEAFQAGGPPGFADVARDILAYVWRDLTGPNGEFYAAEDADSERREGRFYCWTWHELAAILTAEELAVTVGHYGVTRDGNFVDHSDPKPLLGLNVLHIANPDINEALSPGRSPASPGQDNLAHTTLASARKKMQTARALRPRPYRDDKVLASWNGLMLGAFARAHAVLGDPAHLDAARRNLAFLRHRLWDPATRTLHHRWRDNARDTVQLLGAYAGVLDGVVALYETTLEQELLAFGIELADALLARFHDPVHGGFWQTSADCPDLVLRTKEENDGAEPSGYAVAVLALLRLAVITGRNDYSQAAEAAIRFHARTLQDHPEALPHLLLGATLWLGTPTREVIAGDAASPVGKALLRAAQANYHPNLTILGTTGPVDPFARTLPAANGAPTAYVCVGTTCHQPTSDGVELRRHLSQIG